MADRFRALNPYHWVGQPATAQGVVPAAAGRIYDAGGPEILTVENHQGDGCNVLFVDGHVEFVRQAGLSQLRWTNNSPLGKRPPPEGFGPTEIR